MLKIVQVSWICRKYSLLLCVYGWVCLYVFVFICVCVCVSVHMDVYVCGVPREGVVLAMAEVLLVSLYSL